MCWAFTSRRAGKQTWVGGTSMDKPSHDAVDQLVLSPSVACLRSTGFPLAFQQVRLNLPRFALVFLLSSACEFFCRRRRPETAPNGATCDQQKKHSADSEIGSGVCSARIRKRLSLVRRISPRLQNAGQSQKAICSLGAVRRRGHTRRRTLTGRTRFNRIFTLSRKSRHRG